MVKAEARRWRSRSEVQRQAELEAEALEIPYEEVLWRLEKRSGRSGEAGKSCTPALLLSANFTSTGF
ncbi:MAG: hypothetical protein AVDCRST_MAG58-2489 [uncultured Rubrobacteraceae bacterium]|uniref:Uncharacterized protein n=1 Tax=uncultured Rubrobacteraceae bacterium TaxID=349277 RepID=A0A6J4R0J4_9ACTN|nr:MAG: hypothetical protein AVDCRST_MAG58-2489 [uncultured Rubrobacteraceae bacterium]